MIVYISIGNSDDKLPQRRWAAYMLDVRLCLRDFKVTTFGVWSSFPDSIYQNASYCFEVKDERVPELKGNLSAIAKIYEQDAIAWNAVTTTEFLGPGGGPGKRPAINRTDP